MKKITQLHQGDFLTFKASDGNFKLLFCTSVYKESSPHNFTLAATNYNKGVKPTLESIYRASFYGVTSRTNSYFDYSESEQKRIWTNHPEIKPNILGSYGLTIWRKEFLNFRDNFEIIETCQILPNLDKNGNGSMNASDMTVLDNLFLKNIEQLMELRGQKLFRINAILKN